jgi:UPF0755 protein
LRRFLPFLLLLSAAAYVAGYREVHAPRRAVDAPPQPLSIPTGASVESIGRALKEKGLVRHTAVFRAWVLLRGDAAHLKAGEYVLEGPLSLDQAIDLLVQGQVVRHDLTVPEGKSLRETAMIAAARGIDGPAFVAAASDPSSMRDLDPDARDLEGYLFPDTYDVPRGAGAAAELVRRMTQRFREVMMPELPRARESGLTLRQVVTVASLVELETAQGEERPRIAAVFLNRMKKGMLLQTDPTVIYALRLAGTYDGNIRKKDLSLDSPYNTYKYAGLPPGPIASPGREALRAVLYPSPVKDLYFVSRNDGTHQFSETLAEHSRAVDRYQRHRTSGS